MPEKKITKGKAEAKSGRVVGAQTLERGLELIDAVFRGIVTVEALAQETELTRSTAHRLLTVLTRSGYLRHKTYGGYQLGPRLIELGFFAHKQLDLPTLGRPFLEELTKTTGEVSHLGVLDGRFVAYIDKVHGTRELQLASQIGGRLPTHCTALGKALVAARSREDWLNHFTPGMPHTARTITDSSSFVAELERVRQKGFALDFGEDRENIICLAAVVYDASGEAAAGISVSTASLYMPDHRIPLVAEQVKDVADRFSAELGWCVQQNAKIDPEVSHIIKSEPHSE